MNAKAADKTEKDITKLFDKNIEVRRRALARLIKSGDKLAREKFLELLNSSDDSLCRLGVEAAGKLRMKEALPYLHSILKNTRSSSSSQYEVLTALTEIGDPSSVPFIISHFKELNYPYGAGEALGKIGIDDEQVDEIIQIMLTGATKNEKKNAANVLSKIKSKKSIPALIKALSDAEVQSEAAHALGEIQAKEALPALFALMDSKEHWVMLMSSFAVGRIGLDECQLENIFSMVRAGKQSGVYALSQIKSEKAVEVLIEAFTNKEINTHAMRATRDIGKDALPMLIKAMEHKDFRVRQRAAEALGLIRDQRATISLIKEMETGNSITKRKCIVALGRIKDPSSIPALVSMLKNGNGEQRALAAQAIGRIKNKAAFIHLKKALNDPEQFVVCQALFALGETKDQRAIPYLLKLFHENKFTEESKKALVKIGLKHLEPKNTVALVIDQPSRLLGLGDCVFPYLIRAQKSESVQVRINVGNFLIQAAKKGIPNPKLITMLKRAFCDSSESVQDLAADGLGYLAKDPARRNSSLAFLRKHIMNNDLPHCQEAAAQGLEKAASYNADISFAFGSLKMMLGSDSKKARSIAAKALSNAAGNKMQEETVICMFEEVLLEGESNSFGAVCHALSNPVFKEAKIRIFIPPLFAAMGDASLEKRGNAADALLNLLENKHDGGCIFEMLLGLLRDKNPCAQESALKAIAKAAYKRDVTSAIDQIFIILREGSHDMRNHAADSLAKIVQINSFQKRSDDIIQKAMHALSENDPDARNAGASVLAKSCNNGFKLAECIEKMIKEHIGDPTKICKEEDSHLQVNASLQLQITSLITILIKEPLTMSICDNILMLLSHVNSTGCLDELRNEIINEVRSAERFKEPAKRVEAAKILKCINSRKNELLSTDVHVDRKSLKPPSAKGAGGHYRIIRGVIKTRC